MVEINTETFRRKMIKNSYPVGSYIKMKGRKARAQGIVESYDFELHPIKPIKVRFNGCFPVYCSEDMIEVV